MNSSRDKVNAERSMRTSELAKVHSILVRAGIDGFLSYKDENGNVISTIKEIEDAIGKIYLYGTNEQISLAQEYIDSFTETQGADGTQLVDSLRDHVRESLGLEQTPTKHKYLRIKLGPKGEA